MNPHRAHPFSIVALLVSVWSNRRLILQMTKRDVIGRYRGSVLGILWSLFNPLLMLAVYTFVFSVVFKARWGTASDSKTEFAIVLFAGMIAFGLFVECINRAPGLVVSNVIYVKKVIFPLEILPWVILGGAVFHASISFAVLMIFYLLVNQMLHWTMLLTPLVLLPLLLMAMGLSWFLSALGVYLRDVGQTVVLFTSVLMFLSPIFYPVSSLPEGYRFLLMLNPLSYMIEEMRNVLIFGRLPDWTMLGLYTVGCAIIAWLGFAFFQKARNGFADVL